MDVEVVIECLRKRTERATPHEPDSYADVVEAFTGDWRDLGLTRDGEQTLFVKRTGLPGHQAIVFTSDRMIRWHNQAVRNPEHATLIDATFHSAPSNPPSRQVLRLGVLSMTKIILVAWAVMESKSTEAYLGVFVALRDKGLVIRKAMTDKEPAERNALRQVFGGGVHFMILYCYFHYLKAMILYAESICRLRAFLDSSHALLLGFRMLLLVPRLKFDLIVPTVNTLIIPSLHDKGLWTQRVRQLFSHFDTEFLEPLQEELSVFGNPQNSTTSPLEGSHRWFNAQQEKNPGFWAVHRTIRDEEQQHYDKTRKGITPALQRRAMTALVQRKEFIKNLERGLKGIDDVWQFMQGWLNKENETGLRMMRLFRDFPEFSGTIRPEPVAMPSQRIILPPAQDIVLPPAQPDPVPVPLAVAQVGPRPVLPLRHQPPLQNQRVHLPAPQGAPEAPPAGRGRGGGRRDGCGAGGQPAGQAALQNQRVHLPAPQGAPEAPPAGRGRGGGRRDGCGAGGQPAGQAALQNQRVHLPAPQGAPKAPPAGRGRGGGRRDGRVAGCQPALQNQQVHLPAPQGAPRAPPAGRGRRGGRRGGRGAGRGAARRAVPSSDEEDEDDPSIQLQYGSPSLNMLIHHSSSIGYPPPRRDGHAAGRGAARRAVLSSDEEDEDDLSMQSQNGSPSLNMFKHRSSRFGYPSPRRDGRHAGRARGGGRRAGCSPGAARPESSDEDCDEEIETPLNRLIGALARMESLAPPHIPEARWMFQRTQDSGGHISPAGDDNCGAPQLYADVDWAAHRAWMDSLAPPVSPEAKRMSQNVDDDSICDCHPSLRQSQRSLSDVFADEEDVTGEQVRSAQHLASLRQSQRSLSDVLADEEDVTGEQVRSAQHLGTPQGNSLSQLLDFFPSVSSDTESSSIGGCRGNTNERPIIPPTPPLPEEVVQYGSSSSSDIVLPTPPQDNCFLSRFSVSMNKSRDPKMTAGRTSSLKRRYSFEDSEDCLLSLPGKANLLPVATVDAPTGNVPTKDSETQETEAASEATSTAHTISQRRRHRPGKATRKKQRLAEEADGGSAKVAADKAVVVEAVVAEPVANIADNALPDAEAEAVPAAPTHDAEHAAVEKAEVKVKQAVAEKATTSKKANRPNRKERLRKFAALEAAAAAAANAATEEVNVEAVKEASAAKVAAEKAVVVEGVVAEPVANIADNALAEAKAPAAPTDDPNRKERLRKFAALEAAAAAAANAATEEVNVEAVKEASAAKVAAEKAVVVEGVVAEPVANIADNDLAEAKAPAAPTDDAEPAPLRRSTRRRTTRLRL
ncbi:uncharacterized protein LOC117647849 [Thrips palmi]|uniref:Uncharacterized protein LOC117647849 n=1 Tax=Thrips palmi TaxID=161013 RepID=A0A6P8YZV7_THRPL|nr:uncharacterized protein LOC117647849 [Thrips palmi]